MRQAAPQDPVLWVLYVVAAGLGTFALTIVVALLLQLYVLALRL